MLKLKKNQGITLVALIITIIILLILAGIAIGQLTGSGIFENAKTAKEKYENAQEIEDIEISKLANQIDSYVNGDRADDTIKQELKREILAELRQELSVQPTGTKVDVYAKNSVSETAKFSDYTSMSGATVENDEDNKISEYLSYSETDGYEVLKSGWYMIELYSKTTGKGTSASTSVFFNLNDNNYTSARSWASTNGMNDYDLNTFSIYLVRGDKFYVSFSGGGSGERVSEAEFYCNPMF